MEINGVPKGVRTPVAGVRGHGKPRSNQQFQLFGCSISLDKRGYTQLTQYPAAYPKAKGRFGVRSETALGSKNGLASDVISTRRLFARQARSLVKQSYRVFDLAGI